MDAAYIETACQGQSSRKPQVKPQLGTRNFVSCIATALVLTVIVATAHTSTAQPSATLLQITSPADHSRVAPGQTVSVTVTSSTDTSVTAVGLIGENPIGFSDLATSVPAQFSLAIPGAIGFGPHMLTAIGTTASGLGVQSATILIDVERPDMPVKLSALMSEIFFEAVGEHFPVIVLGTFSDGKVFDLTKSSNLVYSSNNPSVASVEADGIVTTHSPGSGFIIATYRKDNQSILLNVPFNLPPGSTTPVQRTSPERPASGAASLITECRLVRPGMSKGEVLGLFTPKTSLPINKEVACVQCFPRERFAQNTWRLEGREMDCVVDFDANGKVLRTRFVAAEPD
jgi:hypothetical protein